MKQKRRVSIRRDETRTDGSDERQPSSDDDDQKDTG